MSTIKLENIQTRTGSGTITIGASGETVALGSGATLGSGMGKVLQVVQGTTTTTTAQTSVTWSDTTLSASITPSSTSNKILVLVNQFVQIFRASIYYAGGSLRLVRDSTTVYAGDLGYQYYYEVNSGTNINMYDYKSLSYLDSPSTTSSITYKTQQRSTDAADSITTQQASAKSTIILMEIAG